MKYIKFFNDIKITDIASVGGKTASLGQMISSLSDVGVRIPQGFAVTAQAYWYFLEHNNLVDKIRKNMLELKDYNDSKILKKVSHEIRDLIKNGDMPQELQSEIELAYLQLCKLYECDNKNNFSVAVRSSATAEDLPGASFAGQQETFLNVRGEKDLIESCKKCMASLFTERAIVYRIEKGFDHFKVALSVCVQKMIRSDLASAGVIFTLDTESGFPDIITINSSYGLGEIVVKGEVIPDEFFVFKPALEAGFRPIVKKTLGDKNNKIVYSKNNKKIFTKTISTSLQERDSFTLSDLEILELSRYSIAIEKHYSNINNKWTPMDIEWAKDGQDGRLYILQARPETIHGLKNENASDYGILKTYKLEKIQNLESKILVTGQSIGNKIVSGKIKVIKDAKDISQVQAGDILVTQMTDPDWVPAMKKASAIVTDRGGRTCHAAIVSRELNIPAIVGTKNGTEILQNGQEVTVDCSQGQTGFIYSGVLDFEVFNTKIEEITLENFNNKYNCKVMVNIADPSRAFVASFLPNDGVGLARIEFIVSNTIQIHPMALIAPEKIQDAQILEKIEYLTRAYKNKSEFFVDRLACGIGNIAAAFYPKPVIVRFSDFKTNEYRNLIGGQYFEPQEENPMIGWRGASRYYNQNYSQAFALECQAVKKCIEIMGLNNIKVMIPFVRTLKEAELVLLELEKNGLKRGARVNLEACKDDIGSENVNCNIGESDFKSGTGYKEFKGFNGALDLDIKQGACDSGLEIIMMCEIPSNVILIEEFCKFFDGFSIGSNDLTQLTLGVDRDSGILSKLFDERDPAVKKMMALAIEGAKKHGKPIGICGQAPSDLPEIAKFLISFGINSISLNPDSLGQFLMQFEDK